VVADTFDIDMGSGEMDIETYIRQLEESKERGNKVTSIDNVLSLLRSIRHKEPENGRESDFHSQDELRVV
jgi:hypothetical protein